MTKDYIMKFDAPEGNNRVEDAYALLENFARMREMFISKDMEPPAAIHLKSRDEGARFLYQMQPLFAMSGGSGGAKLLKMEDDSLYVEIDVMGIKVRWPEHRLDFEPRYFPFP